MSDTYTDDDVSALLGPKPDVKPAAKNEPPDTHGDEDVFKLLGPNPKTLVSDWDERINALRGAPSMASPPSRPAPEGAEHTPGPDTKGPQAFAYGAADPYFKGKQIFTYLMQGDEAAIKEGAEREKKYQKEVGPDHQAERTVGNLVGLAPAAAVAPEGMLGRVALGAALGATNPVVNKDDGSFLGQTATDSAITAGLGEIPSAAKTLTRTMLRGGDSKVPGMLKNIADLKRAGITEPALGQVSEGGFTKATGTTPQNILTQTQQVEAKIHQLADKISAAKTPEEAGNTLIEGIEGTRPTKDIQIRKGGKVHTVEAGPLEGGFIGRAREAEGKLYDTAYALVGPDTPVWLNKTFSTLRDLVKPSPNMPATSAMMKDPGFRDLMDRLKLDTGPSRSVRFEDLRDLKSWVGQQTDPSNLTPVIDKAQANRLYGAIAEDEMALAERKGPKAELAMRQAIQYSRTMHDTIDTHIQPVLNAKTPEKVYQAVLENSKNGASRVRTILESLDPVQSDVVRGVAFRELGRDGSTFSPAKYLTNYRQLHPDVRDALWGKSGSSLRNSMDKIADASASLAAGDRSLMGQLHEYALKHKTAGGLATLAYITSAAGPKAIVTSGLLGFVTGRMVKNPKILQWLAQTSTKSTAMLPYALQTLEKMKPQLSYEDQGEVDQYLNNLKSDPMMIGK